MRTLFLSLVALGAVGCGAGDPGADESALTQTPTGNVTFTCSTVSGFDGKKQKAEFTVLHVDTAPELYWDGETESPVRASPENSPLVSLGENGGAILKKGNLVIDGDADGFYLLELKLLKSSGFKTGKLVVEDIGGVFGGDFKSDVKCTLEKATGIPDENPDGLLHVGDYEGVDEVDVLRDIFDYSEEDGTGKPFVLETDEHSAADLLTAYAKKRYPTKTGLVSYTGTHIKAGSGKIELVKRADAERDVVAEALDGQTSSYFEKAAAAAEETMDMLMVDNGNVFAYDGLAKSACGELTPYLLVLELGSGRISGVDLETCVP